MLRVQLASRSLRASHPLRHNFRGFTRSMTTMAPGATTTTSGAPSAAGPPLIISGPSGVGKGTLYKLLLERHPLAFCTSVSHTTRAPRPGEAPGVDYHFVSRADFDNMVAAGDFLEHATFGGNCYGTSRSTVEEKTSQGRRVVLDIEMEGVKQIKQSPLQASYIFIAPPSMAVLEQRLRGRGTESEDSIVKRLTQARAELAFAETPGVHDVVIVNDDLETAYKELEAYCFKGSSAHAGKEGGSGDGDGVKTQQQGVKDEGMAGVSVLD